MPDSTIGLASDLEMLSMLRLAKRIAVVGASPKPWRESHDALMFLLNAGYEVYPVNPHYDEIEGLQCYASLGEIPVAIDIVNIFRNPEFVPSVVEEAIASGAKMIWMQVGVIHQAAARRAIESGLTVVMDRCIMVEHRLRLRA